MTSPKIDETQPSVQTVRPVQVGGSPPPALGLVELGLESGGVGAGVLGRLLSLPPVGVELLDLAAYLGQGGPLGAQFGVGVAAGCLGLGRGGAGGVPFGGGRRGGAEGPARDGAERRLRLDRRADRQHVQVSDVGQAPERLESELLLSGRCSAWVSRRCGACRGRGDSS
ncbi:hypothetical protein GCM10010429_39910 [Micromonospora olivasterospora]